MNRFTRIASMAALALSLTIPSFAATCAWKIDPAHTSAQFAVKHLMISTVRGAFSKVNGTVSVDDQDISKSRRGRHHRCLHRGHPRT